MPARVTMRGSWHLTRGLRPTGRGSSPVGKVICDLYGVEVLQGIAEKTCAQGPERSEYRATPSRHASAVSVDGGANEPRTPMSPPPRMDSTDLIRQ